MRTSSMPPYAPTLIESTRAIGYTLEAAVSDVIDNSIAAAASCIDLFFFPVGKSFVAILDDGKGMNFKKINDAMRYGSQNPNDPRDPADLGRFGLGLKTASLSQCRTLTVISKQQESIEARRWDVDHVNQTGDWSLIILDEPHEFNEIPQFDKLMQLETGTLVIWQNLDRMKMGETNFERAMSKKMDDVRSHLSLVFHRYLSGETGLKKLQMQMNGTPIIPADPFLAQRNTQVMADEELRINGSLVVVRPYILPHISRLSKDDLEALGGKEGLRRRQGFYVYRNKRLLIWGTWFRMMRQGELSKLARIQVDIPNELDTLWTLDIKKSTAIPPEEVRINLESVIGRMAEHSKRTWTYRGKKETKDSVAHVWHRNKGIQGGVYYSINREHPLFTMFSNASPDIRRNLETLLAQIEANIPLNQLYLDLTEEKQVVNEVDTTEQDTEVVLIALLDRMTSADARAELLNRLATAEPFVHHPKLIDKYR